MKKFQRLGMAFDMAFMVIVITLGMLGIVYSVRAYPEVFRTTATLENKEIIKPESIVIINFSEPMIPESVGEGIGVTPATAIKTYWENSNKKLLIAPASNWKPGQKYNLEIQGARNIMFLELNFSFSFETESLPQVIKVSPSLGEKDAVLDIEDPVIFAFDRPLNDYSVKFDIAPFEKLTYNLEKDQPTIGLMAESGFKKGQRYDITVSLKYKKEPDSGFEPVYKTYFETKPPPPAEWSKNLDIRLEQAKKFTEARVKDGKYVDINLGSQVMSIFENGKLLDSFLISSGKRGMGTPIGQTKIYNKTRRAWSKTYGLYMPYWNAIAPDGKFGIHELPEWPSGYKEGAAHLGIPVSHGCVRLGVGSAEKVYNWAPIGTPVIIY